MGAVLLALLMGGACGRLAPAPYHPVSEVPQGPGLLSGDQGGLVIGGRGQPARQGPPAPNEAPAN